MRKIKKISLSQFIGRQLSRLRAGQSYYAIVVSTISALALASLAFPEINILLLIVLFPCILFGAFLLGYTMDKSNVTALDHRKTIEMYARYLNTSDFKNNDFRILQMEIMFEWLKSIQENKPLDFDILKEKYKKFLKKWNPPN